VAVLFDSVYHLLNPTTSRTARADEIALTKDDLRQLAAHWIAQGQTPPTVDQMRALVEQSVNEEILFREAVALGLDEDDEIIKRRLAQKMDFLAADISALQDPGDTELRVWFAQNSGRFALSPRASFRHLYFSFDRPSAHDRAAEVLDKIAGKSADTPDVAARAATRGSTSGRRGGP
jgi:peptidyl-prolyl cis-trans isomerase C